MYRIIGLLNVYLLKRPVYLTAQIIGTGWTEDMLRQFVRRCSLLPISPCQSGSSQASCAWLTELLVDNFVDTFTHFHPEAQDRFTCWDQYKNRRYVNEGARIDYILVDARLVSSLECGPALPCGGTDADSPEAALWAATAGGLWAAAPFDGTGISDAPVRAYDVQFQPIHTGMVYTPPQYSDHIAVSMLINVPEKTLTLDAKQSRACQPHLRQKKLFTFLQSTSRSADVAEDKAKVSCDPAKPSQTVDANLSAPAPLALLQESLCDAGYAADTQSASVPVNRMLALATAGKAAVATKPAKKPRTIKAIPGQGTLSFFLRPGGGSG
jgi:hypothetical protein